MDFQGGLVAEGSGDGSEDPEGDGSGKGDSLGIEDGTAEGDSPGTEDGTADATADGSEDRRVALFVDGPNVLRDEFDVDLDDVREAAERVGRLTATRLYLDEHATPGLIQAAEARGFEVIVTSGDVDVRLAVDLTEFAVERRADVIAIASRDTDFKPAIETANAHGCRTFAIAPGAFGRSDALRNAATDRVTLDGDTTSTDEDDGPTDEDDGPTLVGYDS